MRWFAALSLGSSLVLGASLGFAQGAPPVTAPTSNARATELFESRIRPLLIEKCASCHSGPKAQANLRLDTPEGMLKGGGSGPVVVPGAPGKSLLIAAVSYTRELKMPPQGKLSPQQIADLTAWVRSGARWPASSPPVATGPRPETANAATFTDEQKHFWAFRPVRAPAVPIVKNKAWVKSPIDAFILAKLEAK